MKRKKTGLPTPCKVFAPCQQVTQILSLFIFYVFASPQISGMPALAHSSRISSGQMEAWISPTWAL